MNGLRSHIKNSKKSVSSGIQTPQSRLKKLGCALFFQPTDHDETLFLVFDMLHRNPLPGAKQCASLYDP